MSDSDNSTSKGCLILAVVVFGLAAISTVLGLVFGGKSFLNEFLDDDNEGVNLDYLRFTFILLVIAGGIYLYNNYIKKNK